MHLLAARNTFFKITFAKDILFVQNEIKNGIRIHLSTTWRAERDNVISVKYLPYDCLMTVY